MVPRNPTQRVERRLGRLIDRYAEEIGHHEFELLLQQRAQDMRELSEPAVTPEDVEGWSG